MEGKIFIVMHRNLYQKGTQYVPYTDASPIYTTEKINTAATDTTSNLYPIVGGSGWTIYDDSKNPTRSYVIAQELLDACKEKYGLSSADVMLLEDTGVR